MKITIIGAGNMGGAIARGLAQGSIIKASDITCADPSKDNLAKIKAANADFTLVQDNRAAVKNADIVIIAVKPWLVDSIINEIKFQLDYDKQIIVSIAAGVTFEQLNTYLLKADELEDIQIPAIFRLIPNIAIDVQSSMTFVASKNATEEQEK